MMGTHLLRRPRSHARLEAIWYYADRRRMEAGRLRDFWDAVCKRVAPLVFTRSGRETVK